jgi:ADP-heptose:LPS heptosyltransferase
MDPDPSRPPFPLRKRSPADSPGESYDGTPPVDLGGIAYEKHHAPVFHAWRNLDGSRRREALRDRHVFYSVCCRVGPYLDDLLKIDFEKANAFVSEVLEAVLDPGQRRISRTEEWFRGLEHLAGTFIDRNYLREARTIVDAGFRTGVSRFPLMAMILTVHAAYLDALAGRRDFAAKMALPLVLKPFLLPDSREIPGLYRKLAYILSAGNRLAEYRLILWKGASSFHVDAALRESFADQIVKTYRGAHRALLRREVPPRLMIPFLIGNAARILAEHPVSRSLRAHLPLRWLHLASLYLLNRSPLRNPFPVRSVAGAERIGNPFFEGKIPPFPAALRQRILVTRAMGGIGDLLMMTPGLTALAAEFPDAQIDFAIPRPFHPIFENFPSARILDIHEDAIDLARYHRWFNLTECPAGRVESRQSPDVRRNRTEIFARAMGISRRRLRRTAGFIPFYRVTEGEKAWASEFLENLEADRLPIVGVQPYAADSYRNWPFMETFVETIAKTHRVLVFHHEDFPGYDFPNVFKVVQPLRKSVALAARCERLVVLDSSFLHLSAALGIPTVAIFGAVSGRLRTQDYPGVRLLAPDKKEFPCYPCWRHEHKPCHLTNGRESICFRSVSVEQAIEALYADPDPRQDDRKVGGRISRVLLYGRE